MTRTTTRSRTVEYSIEQTVPQKIEVTYIYTVTGPQTPQVTAGELKLGDRVWLSRLTDDAGYGFAASVPYRRRGPVGVVTEIRREVERPDATAAQRRLPRRMLVTFEREGAMSLDVLYVVPDSPVVLAKEPGRAASS